MSNGDKIRRLLEPERERLIGRVLENAFSADGNTSNRALELALSRLAPAPKQDSERVVIPGFKTAVTLQEKAEAVIDAIATGQISVEAGERLLRVLDTYARSVLATDHEKRLQALEEGRRPPVVVDAEIVEPGVIP
jgi:hypothetical protein